MITRFDPLNELLSWQRDLAQSRGYGAGAGDMPATDIYRTDEAFVVRMDLPGVTRDDVDITADDGRLVVTAVRHDAVKDGQDVRWLRRERRHGQATRTFTLPDGIATDMISASLDAGVLEIRIPQPPERQPRQIPIDVTA